MPAASSSRRLVLVAGAGRSGTSTVAGILQILGLHVPKPEVVPDETNPKGFGEPQWVVDFHTELLGRANVQVSDARPSAWARTSELAERPRPLGRLTAWLEEQLGYADRLLVKDPRLSWFLPLWRAAAERAGVETAFLTMLRPPAEVVGSKRTYYNRGLADAHGVAAWANMMLNTERATRGPARAFVRYHDLLDDWRGAVGRIAGELDLTGLGQDDPSLATRIDAFVDPGLRRVTLDWPDLDLPDRLESIARHTWAGLDSLAAGEDARAAAERLDEVHETYDSYYLEAETVARSSIHAARARRTPAPAAQPAPPPSVLTRAARRGRALLAGRR